MSLSQFTAAFVMVGILLMALAAAWTGKPATGDRQSSVPTTNVVPTSPAEGQFGQLSTILSVIASVIYLVRTLLGY
jgi:hypothetical protein